VLHSRGWKSVYHPEALAFGLAPGSASSFHVQRLRWAQGSMQILRKFNPLFLKGLTPAQRTCYFAANVYPIDGLQKLIFYLAPVVFLFTGIVPVQADTEALMARLIPYLVLSIGSFELVARGTGWLFIQERYNMAKFFIYILSLPTLLTNKKLKFNVTPKGVTGVPFRTYAPQLCLLIVSAAALLWAPLAYNQQWIYYDVGSMDVAFWFSGAWVGWNVYFAASVVRLSLTAKQQRGDHRFDDQFPLRVRVLGAEGVDHRVALSHNLNPQGLAFRSMEAFETGAHLQLVLPLSTREVTVQGEIVHVQKEMNLHGDIYIHGVRFSEMPIDVRDAIELHCTQHAWPLWRNKYRQSLDLMVRATELVRNARASTRRAVFLPAHVFVGDEQHEKEIQFAGLLEELSRNGARLLMDAPFAPGTPLRFEVPGTALKAEGEVVFSRAIESPMSVRFSVGVKVQTAPRGLPAVEAAINNAQTPVRPSAA
jgi:cellulose synthase (UDP-forming)